MVATDGGHAPDDAVARPDLAPLRRQDVARAVEVEEDETARRPTEVVDARHGLLPAVAALVQVHRGAQPVELVDDGAVVGLETQARAPRSDPERLCRPESGQRPISHGRNEIGARHEDFAPRSLGAGMPVDGAVCRRVADEVGPRVAPGEGLTDDRLAGVRFAEHGPVVGDEGDLDAQHEAHLVEPVHAAPGRRRARS